MPAPWQVTSPGSLIPILLVCRVVFFTNAYTDFLKRKTLLRKDKWRIENIIISVRDYKSRTGGIILSENG